MAEVFTLALREWKPQRLSQEVRAGALDALESGQILYFPELRFDPPELTELRAANVNAEAKNISFNTVTGRVAGADGAAVEPLKRVMAQYASDARALVSELLPRYARALRTGRTSFRPVEIAGRESSWRKDDTRLHVDSFPATPVQGQRILRVFSNVDPRAAPRLWRTGEPFDAVAARYAPQLPAPFAGSGFLLRALRVTKSRRTPYDHYMLQLHDAMKADDDYQKSARQAHFEFPAGSTWMVYTDAVSHAAMQGRGAFEQTFYVPVEAMADAARSPLRILERLLGRSLV